MAKKICIVTGGKGGVGKTLVSKSLTEYLLEQGENVLAIDADVANPGLHKAFEPREGQHHDYPAKLALFTLNLAQVEGWSALITLCDDLPDHTVVIDTPAGSHECIQKFAVLLERCLGELERDWCSLFVTSGQRDSLELFADYLELTPRTHVVHAILNANYGDARSFERFLKSNTRLEVLSRQGAVAWLPELAKLLVSMVDSDRIPFGRAARQYRIGHRSVLRPWLDEVHTMLQQLRLAA